jgi:hypothetical protein
MHLCVEATEEEELVYRRQVCVCVYVCVYARALVQVYRCVCVCVYTGVCASKGGKHRKVNNHQYKKFTAHSTIPSHFIRFP